jgi:hypothetical protein
LPKITGPRPDESDHGAEHERLGKLPLIERVARRLGFA